MSRFLTYKLDHAIFWGFTIFFHGYTRLALLDHAGVGQFLLEVVWRNVLLAAAIYATILYAIPRFTSGKKMGEGVIVILIGLGLYVAGKSIHDVYLYEYGLSTGVQISIFTTIFYNLSIVLFYVSFASTLYLSKQWYLQREIMRKIEVEKLNTELQYLRAQINPHFLFNSINTIYFQIDKQNTKARETLEKFSDMLRYQLYECVDAEIEIEKEVHYLNNYSQLQQLRLNDNYDVQIDLVSDLRNFSIPPMLLLPFVENAFKHISHFTHRKNEIEISMASKDGVLQLKVANTKESALPMGSDGGIGLKNVKRRLDLIYGDRYFLDIQNSSDYFVVLLEIPIQ
jgi:sensor histidine kinase YesM